MKKVTFIVLLWLSAVGFAYAQNNDDWVLLLLENESAVEEIKMDKIHFMVSKGLLTCFSFTQENNRFMLAWKWDTNKITKKVTKNDEIKIFRGAFCLKFHPFKNSYFNLKEELSTHYGKKSTLFIHTKTGELKMIADESKEVLWQGIPK
jgi:hypothetical protein